jgi:hypothetical protein
MFPEVYDAILRDWNPNLTEAHWQRAFVHRGTCDEDYFGYALADGGRIVGMLGMIFSQRTLGGKVARFCNLHSWHVQEEYRAKSLMLMKPVLALKEHTITDFTPTETVSMVSKRLGFTTLDNSMIVLPRAFASGRAADAVVHELNGQADPVAAEMDSIDAQIYRDHLDLDCGHLYLRDETGYCYVVYSRIDVRILPFCLVHYVSDCNRFLRHQATIRSHLLHKTGVQYVVVEARMLEGARVPLSFYIRAKARLYKSTTVTLDQVDTLYSEVAYLKHSTLFSMRERLRSTAQRYIPHSALRLLGVAHCNRAAS